MSEERKYCILVVDDAVLNIKKLYDILSPLYMLKTAKDGQTAIKLAERFIPDLILLDIVMPVMSGYEVIKHLKESNLTRHIPVIFVSGLENDEDEKKGLLLGAADYIKKPFDKLTVRMKIAKLLKHREKLK